MKNSDKVKISAAKVQLESELNRVINNFEGHVAAVVDNFEVHGLQVNFDTRGGKFVVQDMNLDTTEEVEDVILR